MNRKTEVEKCFVIMPTGTGEEYRGKKDEADYIYYNIIQSTVDSFNKTSQYQLILNRETEGTGPRAIADNIIKKLASAKVCIADLTGMNPNVLLELGIRYSLRNENKTTILMVQENQRVPFDLKPYWYIKYNPFKVDAVKETLLKALQSIDDKNSESHKFDNTLVFRAIADLQITAPSMDLISFSGSGHNEKKELYERWGKWQENATKIRNIFSGPVAEGQFNPDAVLCVSHGRLSGLFTGSILTYGIFTKIKVLSLWGNKANPDMFDNKVNRHMLNGLKNGSKTRKKITLLLIDYKVESGDTAIQAIKYINCILGTDIDIVFCPMFCRDKNVFYQREVIIDEENKKLLRDYLPFNYRNASQRGFEISEQDFFDIIFAGNDILKHPLDFN